MADDLARLLGDQGYLGIEFFVESGHEIGLGPCREGGEVDRPDRLHVIAGGRSDRHAHVVAMSGASSAFMPTT